MPGTTIPEIQKENGVTVIPLDAAYESIDGSRNETLAAVFLTAVQMAEPPLVVIDLSRTTFFASTFLGTLLRASRRMNLRPNGKLAISGLSPKCLDVLQTTQLDHIFNIFASRDEAVETLAKQ